MGAEASGSTVDLRAAKSGIEADWIEVARGAFGGFATTGSVGSSFF